MKLLGRVVLYRLDGMPEIRLYNKTKDVIEMIVRWPDGCVGKFSGYTKNGYLKYNQVIMN